MKTTIKIKINKERILNIFLIVSFLVIIVSIFKILLVPLALNMFKWFISLVKLYYLLDPTAKFFGGFVFLFISFKIFEALVMTVIILIKQIIKIVNKK